MILPSTTTFRENPTKIYKLNRSIAIETFSSKDKQFFATFRDYTNTSEAAVCLKFLLSVSDLKNYNFLFVTYLSNVSVRFSAV